MKQRLTPWGYRLYAIGGRYALVAVAILVLPFYWWDEGVPTGTREWKEQVKYYWELEPDMVMTREEAAALRQRQEEYLRRCQEQGRQS